MRDAGVAGLGFPGRIHGRGEVSCRVFDRPEDAAADSALYRRHGFAVCRCGEPFRRNRGQRYCSRACPKIPRRGRPRRLPDRWCKRPACHRWFRPRVAGQCYCSVRCRARWAGREAVRWRPLFARLYAAGRPMKHLQDRFGLSRRTLQRWRRELGLPRRGS